MRARRFGLWFALSLLALGAAACTPHRGQRLERSPAPGPVVSASPSAPADPRRQALAAYVGMWRAYEKALAADGALPVDLAVYADGSALALLTKAVRDAAAANLRATGTTVLTPRVTGAFPPGDPTQVSVSDCMDTSPTHLVRADGAPYSDGVGGRRLMLARVDLAASGAWRVTWIDLRRVGSC